MYNGSKSEFSEAYLAVTIRTTLADAIQEIRNSPPFDIILLDAELPDADGFEGLDRLHAFDKDVWIYILTGRLDERYRGEAKQRGAKNFILKPLGVMPLIVILHEGAENRRNQCRLKEEKERIRNERDFYRTSSAALQEECKVLEDELKHIKAEAKEVREKQTFNKLEKSVSELKKGLKGLAVAR
jgi:DNA-binding response OmpR family regulator